ncbi:MAG: glutathione synthase/RimK-type ligase-like ATP-grasp enzyme [Verrucomicrobiales bacterium]|jgi:glutathione synthase/RimK-type ligase-like ATP-grasp enzyme
MPRNLIVIEQPEQWISQVMDAEVIAANDYLTDLKYAGGKHVRVYNLCRSYRYQSAGYYVSLLAEARGHMPFPSVSTIQDMKSSGMVRSLSKNLHTLIQSSLSVLVSDQFILSVYFGRNLAKRYERLAKRLAGLFPSPLVRANFVRDKKSREWKLSSLSVIPTDDVPDAHWDFVIESAQQFFKKPQRQITLQNPKFFVAILVDPAEPTPPSDERALRRFSEAAGKWRIETEVITRDDLSRLGVFDGLFIRATTSVEHYTYRFARQAEARGMTVIDDPVSIVRCTNKVFLAELLHRHRIPTPRTRVIYQDNWRSIVDELGLPLILKLPDSAFSVGVCKVSSEEELEEAVVKMQVSSDLIIAQEFVPTDFDWRIGVLDGKPLFACQYHMARGHWQIYNNKAPAKRDQSGDFDCVPLDIVPEGIVETAVRACDVIGKGFYGVDLKEIDSMPVVIEVNDNPSLEAGVEDKLLREELWDRLAETFYRRMEAH